MENVYTAYTKIINGVTLYFVKKYKTFPEYKNVEPILETYGMHADFEKACNIARIDDRVIRKQLLENLEHNSPTAKLVHINAGKVITSKSSGLNDAQKAI